MTVSSARHLLIAGAGCLLVSFGGLMHPTKRVVLNTTASVPLGFYWLDDRTPSVGDLALVRPPPELARWMAKRGYLPLNVPLIKRVAAVDGQTVCWRGGRILIDNRPAATILQHDRLGRLLAVPAGCRKLGNAEIFLLNSDAPHSLDGRYFGPLQRQAVVGRLEPVWTWER